MWFIIPLPRREFYWVKSREIRTKRGCIGDRNWFLDFCWGRSLLTAWVALVDSRTRSPKRWKPCSELHHAVMPPKQFTKWKCPLWKSGTSNIQSHTQQKRLLLLLMLLLLLFRLPHFQFNLCFRTRPAPGVPPSPELVAAVQHFSWGKVCQNWYRQNLLLPSSPDHINTPMTGDLIVE